MCVCSLYVCLWRDYTRIHVYTYIRIYIDCNPYMRRQTYKLEIHSRCQFVPHVAIRIYAYTYLYLSNLKQYSQIEIHYTFRQTIHVTHSLPMASLVIRSVPITDSNSWTTEFGQFFPLASCLQTL